MTAVSARRSDVDVPLTAAVLDQPHIGVAVCDADGVLVELNGALATMIGTPYQRSGSDEWSACYHLYAADGVRPLAPEEAPLARALCGESVVDTVIATRPPGQEVRYLRCNCARIFHADGQLAGAVAFVVDTTASVREQRALDGLRERLVDTVNHELRTPAAALKGHVELLEELREELPERAVWSVDALGRNLARMERILDRISHLADEATARGERI